MLNRDNREAPRQEVLLVPLRKTRPTGSSTPDLPSDQAAMPGVRPDHRPMEAGHADQPDDVLAEMQQEAVSLVRKSCGHGKTTWCACDKFWDYYDSEQDGSNPDPVSN
jgi:hypothetical protein